MDVLIKNIALTGWCFHEEGDGRQDEKNQSEQKDTEGVVVGVDNHLVLRVLAEYSKTEQNKSKT